ncbi:MAG TPA: glycosyltransferase family 2 protein [Ignavibacteria bacterium]|nr:glycosyltransferase family 2 protein [Ignavibacteria bacterium]
MTVSVIIVNYNTGAVLKECVESVYKFEDPAEFKIIIVDNNSTDDSEKIIKELCIKHKEVKNIFLNEKVSFSEANNIGFDISKGEYVLIMNPDIIFTEPLFDKLKNKFHEKNNIGAVSPLLIGTDGIFQRRYFQRFPSLTQFILFYSVFAKIFEKSDYLLNKYLQNNELNTESGRVEFTEQIPCAFLMTTRKIFVESGKMDAGYKLFFEDVDLCYQIGKNYKIAVDTSLKVTHLGGSSFKTSDDHWLHGRFIISMINFFNKNYSGSKTFVLKKLVLLNSYFVLFIERINSIFGKEDEYRSKKHNYLLSEYNKTYK